MADTTEKFPVWQLTREEEGRIKTAVAREFPLTIVFNDRELVSILCLPDNLLYLAVGFLASEGLINSKDDIKTVRVDGKVGVARIETGKTEEFDNELIFKRIISSGCGRGLLFTVPLMLALRE
jgi:FdhD protein